MEDSSSSLPLNSLVLIGKLFTKPRYFCQIKKSRELQCEQAHLHHNDHSQIIKDIVHIKFTNLTFLQLSNNNIVNIEAIQFLQSQKLKTIHLSFNYFREAKTLRKCVWRNLEKLSLMGTKICELNFLQQCHFPILNNILLEDNKNQGDARFNNLSPFSKTSFWPASITKIDKDIFSSKTFKMLQKRKRIQ